jgi:hypothetical protein
MNAQDILKLVNAGYTKEEIQKMEMPAEPKKAPEAPKEEPKKEEPKKAPEAPKEEPAKEDPVDAAMAAAQQKMDSFNAAMDSMIEKISKMAGMPAIGTTAPKGVEDVVSDFFKEEK